MIKVNDTYYGLSVFLEEPVGLAEVANIIAAIRMIKGVADVRPLVSHPELYWAREKARSELSNRLWETLQQEPQEIDEWTQLIT